MTPVQEAEFSLKHAAWGVYLGSASFALLCLARIPGPEVWTFASLLALVSFSAFLLELKLNNIAIRIVGLLFYIFAGIQFLDRFNSGWIQWLQIMALWLALLCLLKALFRKAIHNRLLRLSNPTS